MLYFFLKATHITTVVVWMGAMITASAFMVKAPPTQPQLNWLRRVMTIGLIFTWTTGLWIAIDAGWFKASWMHYKMLAVLLLTALHGVLVGRLRKQLTQHGAFWKALPIIIFALVFGAAFLASAKFA